MNTVVTSKEAILKVSRELIQTQGWSSINIRTVAAACNISTGSIYNYFHSKSDLVSSTVESVWKDIFHFPEGTGSVDSFFTCVQWIFDCVEKGDRKYPGFLTLHSISFMGEEREDGQKRMMQSWDHIRQGMCTILSCDRKIRPGVFDSEFTPEKFVDIIFSAIVASLLRHDYDPAPILGMIRRLLYE